MTAPAEPEAPPHEELVPQRPVTEHEAPEYPAPRFLLNSVVGSAATIGGAAVGGALLIIFSDCSPFEGLCSEELTLAPMILGGWAASSVSVYGMGNWLNGRGNLMPTMIGGAVGTGVSILIYVTSRGEAIYAMMPLPAIGAAIGYELSNAHERAQLEQARPVGVGLQLMPVVGRTPEGGILGGLVGRF
jgi:hypothetical protein